MKAAALQGRRTRERGIVVLLGATEMLSVGKQGNVSVHTQKYMIRFGTQEGDYKDGAV